MRQSMGDISPLCSLKNIELALARNIESSHKHNSWPLLLIAVVRHSNTCML
jgi:hypothetical protein